MNYPIARVDNSIPTYASITFWHSPEEVCQLCRNGKFQRCAYSYRYSKEDLTKFHSTREAIACPKKFFKCKKASKHSEAYTEYNGGDNSKLIVFTDLVRK